MKIRLLGAASALVLQSMFINAYAAVYEFDYTGAFSLEDPNGDLLAGTSDSNNIYYGARAEINGTFYYDDVSNTYDLSMNGFNVTGDTFSVTPISMSLTGSNMDVELGFIWNMNFGQVANFSWDMTGFLAAMAFGVTQGDTISGDVLYDQFGAVLVASLGSATPLSNGYLPQAGSSGPPGTTIPTVPLGPAPLAMSSVQAQPLNPPGTTIYPFAGFNLHFDIGNGNSMTLAGISASPSIVPVPAAVWLFGSGLLGLIGVAKRKKA